MTWDMTAFMFNSNERQYFTFRVAVVDVSEALVYDSYL